MAVPPRVTEWIRRTYPKPTVDPDWLDACLAWISEELHLNDIDTQADEIISNIDSQLLGSDLHDSMLAGTGFPRDIGNAENTRLRGNILVQIQDMTEIGHSAFSLQNVRQTRIDRADLTGLTEDGEEDEGPIPKYPRSMLRFDLSDGSLVVRAVEFRRLPELELGVTPLGYKMILKDVPIRRGIAFLEPSNVELKGSMTEELDANREANFARGLRMRLGQSEPENEEVPVQSEDISRDRLPLEAAPAAVGRAPLREMTIEDSNLRQPLHVPPQEEPEPPTRRRVPASSITTSSSSSGNVISPYFLNTATSTATTTIASSSTLNSVRFSPVHLSSLPGRMNHPTRASEDTDFSDDLQMDEAFFRELDVAERAALDTDQQHYRNLGQISDVASGSGLATATNHSDVIVIDSDSDDKENLAPVVQRRVRQRLADDDSAVIVIE